MPDTAVKPLPRDGRETVVTRSPLLRFSVLAPYAASIGLVAAAAVVSEVSFKIASPDSLTLIFLIAVVVSAQRYGLWPAVLSSLLSVLCWDYFFTLPYYELYFSDPRDYFALTAFLIVALVISGMTAQIRRQNERLAVLAESISRLYRVSQEFSQMGTVDELARFTIARLSEMFRCEAVMVLRGHADGATSLIFPAGHTLESQEIAAAEQKNGLSADAGDGRGRYAFLPLNALRGQIGSVGLGHPQADRLNAEERQELDVFMSQAALAIERAWLARDFEHAQMTAKTEQLRNALLTSVSHDLRTPLTTIIGALSTLKTMGESFSPSIREELLATARSEAERLNRFIGNLLDITRLESGMLTARLVPIDLGEVIETALQRAHPLLAHHVVETIMPPDIPFVSADFAMLEQVFFNLLDNAAKYSPPNSKIQIRGSSEGDHVLIEIRDEGRGIADHASEKMFEKFARFAQGDSQAPGTGLGLMICRGFLKIMNGSISAANRPDRRGAVFAVRLQRAASA